MSRYYVDPDAVRGDPELPKRVYQSYFYKKTPGHNPFLINRWFVPASDPDEAVLDPFEFDLNQKALLGVFHTSKHDGKTIRLHRTSRRIRRSQQCMRESQFPRWPEIPIIGL